MEINIGSQIKEARKKAGMTQKKLALELGKSERMIQKYENNEVTPSFSIIKQISTVLRCDLHNLILDSSIKKIDDALNNIDSTYLKIAERQNKLRSKHTSTDEFELYDLDEYLYSSVVDILTLSSTSKTIPYSLNDFDMDEIDEIANFLYNSYQLKVNEILERHRKNKK